MRLYLDRDPNKDLLRVIAIIILLAIAIITVEKCSAQNCADYLQRAPVKGNTLIVPCDSLIIISKFQLSNAINFERQKNRALVSLSVDKISAVKKLINAYEAQQTTLNGQIKAYEIRCDYLEKTYRILVDTTLRYLNQSKESSDKLAVTLKRQQTILKSLNPFKKRK